MSHLHLLQAAPSGQIIWLLIFITGGAIYFLPTIIAASRSNDNSTAIFFLNLLLGWTVLGYIIAFIWAFSANKTQQTTVVVHNDSKAYSQEYKPANPNPAPAPHIQPAGKSNTTQQDKIDQLRQIKQLLDEGILTQDEFNSQKAIILS